MLPFLITNSAFISALLCKQRDAAHPIFKAHQPFQTPSQFHLCRHLRPLARPYRLFTVPTLRGRLKLSATEYIYDPESKDYNSMRVLSLHRYAVKGLSGDSLDRAVFNEGDGTLEDDRRFALLFDNSKESDEKGGSIDFDDENTAWLHKENFLCAFTAPELLANLETEYRIEANPSLASPERLLTVWDRKSGRLSSPLLGPVNLASNIGRDQTAAFFTKLSGKKVRCVVANESTLKRGNNEDIPNKHTHQFGNTSSGVKNNAGDTRTIHIINQNTVKQFSDAVYGSYENGNDPRSNLSATRFRPNVVVDNLEPWAEFDLIGKTIEVAPKGIGISSSKNKPDTQSCLRFRIVSRTVRCAGVGVDPLQPHQGVLDIPKLLMDNFPEHGPYLGVYAVVEQDNNGGKGVLCVGDSFRVA